MGLDTVQICYDDGVNGESCNSAVSLTYETGGLLAGLVSWWTMDETSGTREDSHGGNDLADNNTVGYEAAKKSNGAQLVGTNSEYLDVASPTDLCGGASSWSFSAWVKFNGPLGYQHICGSHLNYSSNGTENDFFVWVDGDGWLTVTVCESGGASGTFQDIYYMEVAASTWYHIVVVFKYDDLEFEVWVNGTSYGSFGFGGGTPNNVGNTFTLGRLYSTFYATETIDEAAFWRGRELVQADVDTLYNSGSGITYTDL